MDSISSDCFLSFDDVELLSTREGVEYMESVWLSESSFQEAFHGLCSILTRGKDLCSPTKRSKRTANERYFAGISGINCDSPRTKGRLVSGSHRTKVLRLAKGMADQSSRWASISLDEILSVVLLIDTTFKGSVAWSEFYNFSMRVDAAVSSVNGKNSPTRAMSELYIKMVNEHQTRTTKRFMETNNTGKSGNMTEERMAHITTQLIKVAICARLNGMNPLTLLINLKVHERMVIFKAKKEVTASDGIVAAANAAAAAASDNYMPTHALVSLLMHLGAEIIGDEENDVQKARDEFHKKLTNSSAIKPLAAVSAAAAGNNENNVNNISGITPLADDATVTPDAKHQLQIPEEGDNLDESIAQLRENASAISARLASQGKGLDAAINMWSALQTLETELTTANTSVNNTPRTPSPRGTLTSALTSGRESPASSLGGRTSPVQLFSTPGSEQLRTLSAGVACDEGSIASAAERQASAVLNSTMGSNTAANQLSRASPIAQLTTSRANLGIFKSPSNRFFAHRAPKNVYSEETMSWEADKANLTNKYNQRFQTTAQCMDATKIFRVLGVGEGASQGFR